MALRARAQPEPRCVAVGSHRARELAHTLRIRAAAAAAARIEVFGVVELIAALEATRPLSLVEVAHYSDGDSLYSVYSLGGRVLGGVVVLRRFMEPLDS